MGAVIDDLGRAAHGALGMEVQPHPPVAAQHMARVQPAAAQLAQARLADGVVGQGGDDARRIAQRREPGGHIGLRPAKPGLQPARLQQGFTPRRREAQQDFAEHGGIEWGHGSGSGQLCAGPHAALQIKHVTIAARDGCAEVGVLRQSGAEDGSQGEEAGGVAVGIVRARTRFGDELIRQRISEPGALARAAHHKPHPGRDGAREALHRPPGGEIGFDRAEQAHGQFLRTVPGNLGQEVHDGPVGEAGEHAGRIGLEIQPVRRGEARQDVFADQRFGFGAQPVIAHGARYVLSDPWRAPSRRAPNGRR